MIFSFYQFTHLLFHENRHQVHQFFVLKKKTVLLSTQIKLFSTYQIIISSSWCFPILFLFYFRHWLFLYPRLRLLNFEIVMPIKRQIVQVSLSISIPFKTCVLMLIWRILLVLPNKLLNLCFLGFYFVLGHFGSEKYHNVWWNYLLVNVIRTLPSHYPMF